MSEPNIKKQTNKQQNPETKPKDLMLKQKEGWEYKFWKIENEYYLLLMAQKV